MVPLWPGSFQGQAVDFADCGPSLLRTLPSHPYISWLRANPTPEARPPLSTALPPVLVYPATIPKDVSISSNLAFPNFKQYPDATLLRDNARYLSQNHPDLGLSNDLLLKTLLDDRKSSLQNDAYLHIGNRAAACNIHGTHMSNTFVAFPGSTNANSLYIAWSDIEGCEMEFYTHAKPIITFNTPILQIEILSFANDDIAKNKIKVSLGIRTYTEFSTHDVFVSTPKHIQKLSKAGTMETKFPFELLTSRVYLTEERNNNLHLTDFAFSPYGPHIWGVDNVTNKLFKLSKASNGRISTKNVFTYRGDVKSRIAPTQESDIRDSLIRVKSGPNVNTAVFLTTRSLQVFDTRTMESPLLLHYNESSPTASHQINRDICKSRYRPLDSPFSAPDMSVSHYHAFVTDEKLYWIDQRFPLRPVIAFEHHLEKNDPSLSSLLLNPSSSDQTVLIWSNRHPHISAFSVDLHLEDNLAPPQALTSAYNIEPYTPLQYRAGIAVSPRIENDKEYFDLFEAASDGKLFHRLLRVDNPQQELQPQYQHERLYNFELDRRVVHWDEEVQGLLAKDKKPTESFTIGQGTVVVDFSREFTDIWKKVTSETHDSSMPATIIEEKMNNLIKKGFTSKKGECITLAEICTEVGGQKSGISTEENNTSTSLTSADMIKVFSGDKDMSREEKAFTQVIQRSLDKSTTVAADNGWERLNETAQQPGVGLDNNWELWPEDATTELDMIPDLAGYLQQLFVSQSGGDSENFEHSDTYAGRLHRACRDVARDLSYSRYIIKRKNLKKRDKNQDNANTAGSSNDDSVPINQQGDDNDNEDPEVPFQFFEPRNIDGSSIDFPDICKTILSDWKDYGSDEPLSRTAIMGILADPHSSGISETGDSDYMRNMDDLYSEDDGWLQSSQPIQQLSQMQQQPPVIQRSSQVPPIIVSQRPMAESHLYPPSSPLLPSNRIPNSSQLQIPQLPSSSQLSVIPQSQPVSGLHANRKKKKRRIGGF